MNGLGLCIKVDIHEAHIFYAWSLNHNTVVPIATKKNYYLYLNTYTTVFAWGSGNSNKTELNNYIH